MAVKDRIILEAQKANFKWTDYLLRLANCESGLNEFATNDKNNKPEWSKDSFWESVRGMWLYGMLLLEVGWIWLGRSIRRSRQECKRS
jgi:hypothetical protein